VLLATLLNNPVGRLLGNVGKGRGFWGFRAAKRILLRLTNRENLAGAPFKKRGIVFGGRSDQNILSQLGGGTWGEGYIRSFLAGGNHG